MSINVRFLVVSVALALCLAPGCRPDVAAQAPAIVTIVHFNDIGELGPGQGGRVGGLSRLATILKDLKRIRQPVLTTLGGDYLSPSAIGTATVDGQPLAGRQVVDILNRIGLDWATFGNHEFDVSESALRARIVEAKFRLVSSNVTDINGQPFPGTVASAIVPIRAGVRQLRLGLIGLTIDSNRQPWVRFLPPIEAARNQIKRLAGKVDAVVALTHLSLADDQELVAQLPEIDLVLGGHEHENWLLRRGRDFVPIVNTDANVRSVAVLTITFGRPKARPVVSVRFQLVDERIARDPAIETAISRWTASAMDAFRRDGFEPDRIAATTSEPLDARETTVRNRPGRLTDLILAGFVREVGQADVALLNGGSVRVDDVLPAGSITEYDVIRVLPFGGNVVRASLEGSLLAEVLEVGLKNRGIGGYLQTWGVERRGDQWFVQGRPLEPGSRYVVALPDFLLTGRETNLPFLTRDNPAVHNVQDFRDVRRALIEELRAVYPGK